jgi:hypothetical protein
MLAHQRSGKIRAHPGRVYASMAAVPVRFIICPCQRPLDFIDDRWNRVDGAASAFARGFET